MLKRIITKALILLIISLIIALIIESLFMAASAKNLNKLPASVQKASKSAKQNIQRELVLQQQIDLNSDAQIDTVSIWLDKNQKKYVLSVNSSLYQPKENILQIIGTEIVDIDSSDGYKEVLFHYKSNKVEKYVILEYNGKTLKELLNTDSKPIIDGNKEVIVERNMDFWVKKERYVLEQTASGVRTLKLSPQELYYVGVFAYVKKPFVLYSYREQKTKLTTTKKGEKIEIVQCDPSNWFKDQSKKNNKMYDWYMIKTEKGLLGWAMLKDFINCIDIVKTQGQ
ncbi:hypothetical protein Calkr_1715 [Caldicellulosiruptor acetigenus I77R1B]|uniref:Uncharacterized protein n=1 Tax=Caldicellulosiruptor acetigenus (strain ATCC 700853 / DSM 12137 / I77R1B) TaxID=632335 RepID=E4SAI0_CALA7|nr:hypothetical protein [Caldicellulosiruptor acetigenus]ADQ41205.1 hypothetical protein Calkr_1715 [Caldicellulosiruptor acetigenus I77R1B]